MSLTQYLPHVLYATAVTSLAMHALFQRKAAEDERRHAAAQISLLDALARRLRAREDVSPDEFRRLWKLARSHAPQGEGSERERAREAIGWREVFLGTRRQGGEREAEEWDRRDLARVREEVDASERAA